MTFYIFYTCKESRNIISQKLIYVLIYVLYTLNTVLKSSSSLRRVDLRINPWQHIVIKDVDLFEME